MIPEETPQNYEELYEEKIHQQITLAKIKRFDQTHNYPKVKQ